MLPASAEESFTIVDTKYRKVHSFMQNTQSGSLRQLSDYKQYVLSPHIFDSSRYNSTIPTIYRMNRFPVVSRVGAIFPGIINHDDDSHNYGMDKDNPNDSIGIHPILAYPGKRPQDITQFLDASIHVILKNLQIASA